MERQPPHTPERDRQRERDQDHQRRLQMTSPTDRRQRHAPPHNIPPPPPPFPHAPAGAGPSAADPFRVPEHGHVPVNQAPLPPLGTAAIAAMRAQAAALQGALRPPSRRTGKTPIQLQVQPQTADSPAGASGSVAPQPATHSAAGADLRTQYAALPPLQPTGRRGHQSRHVDAQPDTQPVPPPALPHQQMPPPIPRGRPRNVIAPPQLPPGRCPVNETQIQYKDMGHMDKECPGCKALHWVDERLSKSSERNPKFGMCCKQGAVTLPTLQAVPQPLKSLLEAQTADAKDFRKHIRRYNSAFAFTSIGVDLDDSVLNTGRGPYVFKIHGELTHQHGSLIPERHGEPRTYAQLYIHDPALAPGEARALALADRRRHRANQSLNPQIFSDLHEMMEQYNPFVNIYRHAHERLRHQAETPNLHVRLTYKRFTDPR